MGALSFEAHAKVNLYLQVKDRLSSGYHQITSIIQSITLADEITISTANELTLDCDDPRINNRENLVLRAASLLSKNFKPAGGARITLRKKIPMAAGLGGGSADAAATLIGLNKFWGLGLPYEQLAEFAVELGADVSFCLSGGTALVTGFGEKIKPLPFIDLGTFLIIKPTGGLFSGAVYQEFDTLGKGQAKPSENFLRASRVQDNVALVKEFVNDLEPAAVSLMPKINEIKKEAIEAGALACLVSGSGPSMFVIADTKEKRENITERLAGYGRIWLVECAREGITAVD